MCSNQHNSSGARQKNLAENRIKSGFLDGSQSATRGSQNSETEKAIVRRYRCLYAGRSDAEPQRRAFPG